MPGKEWIVDPSLYDCDRPIADLEEIRKYNPQRFEFEMLTGVVYEDRENSVCVGYRDFTDQDFWVRCHMPFFALLPGVLMCEAAAQLASFFAVKYDLLGANVVGLGGLEEIRFRGMVRPGERLVIQIRMVRVRRNRMITCEFKEYVGENLVCDGIIKGIPLMDSSSATPAR